MTTPHQMPRRSLLSRWWAVLGIAAALCLILSATSAALICKLYWNYILGPPGLDPRVRGATRLLAYSRAFPDPATGAYTSGNSDEGSTDGKLFPIPPPLDLSYLAHMRNTDDTVRLLPPSLDAAALERDWISRGVMRAGTPAPPITAARVRALRPLIESTAGLVSGSYGNGLGSTRGDAQVFQLLGPSGEALLFVSLRTGELSNDHLAYYELLYDDTAASPRLLDRRHWRFDVAGVEGMEFVPLAIAFSVASLGLVMPTVGATLAYLRVSKGARVRRGCCPRCGYNLTGLAPGSPCPECGAPAPAASAPSPTQGGAGEAVA